MNKMIKGAVAGTAGIALLAGGFSTYATWTDKADINVGTITTGQLTVDAEPGTWTDQTPGAATTAWDPTTDRMIPGDELQLEQELDIVATGKNLKTVRVTVSGWKIMPDPAATVSDSTLATPTLEDFDFSGEYAGEDFDFDLGTGKAQIDFDGTTAKTLQYLENKNATFEFKMLESATKSMGWIVDLSGLEVTVTQLTD